MSWGIERSLALIGGGLALWASAQVCTAQVLPDDPCRSLVLQAPAQFSTLTDAQPTLRWAAHAPGPYRLQVAVVWPESRLVAAYDLQVDGTQWTLPEAVSVDPVAVKVLVSQGCPQLDLQDLQARGAWFFIDRRADCALDPASLQTQAGRLSWRGVPAAQSYRVRLLRPPAEPEAAFSLIHEAQPDAPFWPLPGLHRPGDVAVVQPVCGPRTGRPQATPLP